MASIEHYFTGLEEMFVLSTKYPPELQMASNVSTQTLNDEISVMRHNIATLRVEVQAKRQAAVNNTIMAQ